MSLVVSNVIAKEGTMFANTEDRLLNFIYALVCCIMFIGGMWALGVTP